MLGRKTGERSMPAGAEGGGTGATGAAMPAKAKDPFCQMEVDVAKARASGLFSEYNGVTWYFDSEECKQGFDAEPKAYLPSIRDPRFLPPGR